MITIWCVYVGDKYPIDLVYNLKKMVSANAGFPFEFKCISDRVIHGIDTVPAVLGLPGWWQKIALFHYADGPSIYFDLDTVICGDISAMIKYTKEKIAMPKNWSQSGHGGWQSSCICWSGKLQRVYSDFKYEAIDRLWGDQEYLSEKLDFIKDIEPGLIVSYKYHCRGKASPPQTACAVTFHGKPDYSEVNDPWVKKFAFM